MYTCRTNRFVMTIIKSLEECMTYLLHLLIRSVYINICIMYLSQTLSYINTGMHHIIKVYNYN